MNVKKLLAYLSIYAVIVISVPLFFNDIWLKDLPETRIYEGATEFSALRAYQDIRYITTNFPRRTIGSENAEASANWIAQEFESMGLKTYKEVFTTRSPEKLMNATIGVTTEEAAKEEAESGIDFDNFSMDGMFEKVNGINVIGISKGKSNETIIIGAHRDTYGTIEGAQDNASGTASMLELARVLTDEEHYYTYMFISFDGEEIGLTGSEAFAKKHSLKNIKLAMILDCVGYKHADTAGLYQFASAKGASPLWTTALANNLIRRNGMKEYYLDVEGGFESLNLSVFTPLMNKMVSQRVSGDVNTDSGPFVDRNIPAVGFIAANAEDRVDPEEIFHTSDDTISNISVDTLNFIGKFSEQYIKSIDLNDFPAELKSNLYIVVGNKYLDYRIISVFIALIILSFLALWYISSRDLVKKPMVFMAFIKRELPWIVSALVLSVFSAFIWQVLRFDFAASFNIIILALLWALGCFSGLLTLIIMRSIALRRNRDNYTETANNQRILLNTIYTVLFIATSIYLNVFVAMLLVGSSLLLMGRVGYKNIASRVFWIIVLFIWFFIQTTMLFRCMQGYVFDIMSIKSASILFVNSLLVNFTFVYVISTPGMTKRKKNTEELQE